MHHPTLSYTTGNALVLYNGARKWFPILFTFINPLLFIINAPFGRFTLKNQSNLFLLDGRISWIIMELPSPSFFLYTFLTAPLAYAAPPVPFTLDSLLKPYNLLALAYLGHYLNRAIISPLRTPSRSKSHIIVPFAAIIFNIFNGTLMGSYLSSPFARVFLSEARPAFYLGLAVWAAGFAGNIYHDEILLNIRRRAKSKGKGKENGTGPAGNGGYKAGEHYAIPQGGLYSLISYPNYFCEWIEWLGFAIAAAPSPVSFSSITPSSILGALNPQTVVEIFSTPVQQWAPTFTPPWIFLYVEIVLMLPRAIRGHQWYHTKFAESYPQERKAVVPFVL